MAPRQIWERSNPPHDEFARRAASSTRARSEKNFTSGRSQRTLPSIVRQEYHMRTEAQPGFRSVSSRPFLVALAFIAAGGCSPGKLSTKSDAKTGTRDSGLSVERDSGTPP